MRILFVVHSFPPEGTRGAQVQTLHLARALTERHDVAVTYPLERSELGPNDATLEEGDLDGVRTFKAMRGPAETIRHLGFSHAPLEGAFAEVLTRWRPDAVHVHHLSGWPLPIIDYSASLGLPLVATLRDFYPMCGRLFMTRPDWTPCDGPAGGLNCAQYCRWQPRAAWPLPGGWRGALSRFLASLLGCNLHLLAPSVDDFPLFYYTLRTQHMRRVMRLFDKVLCPSRFLMNHFKRWVDSDKLAFCEHGFDQSLFEHAERQPSDVVRFGYLGGICYEKGVDMLVDVFNAIEPSTAVLKVHGELDTHAEAPAIRAGARSASISFEGPFDNDNVGTILSGIDCLVLPSRVCENSPIGIREAYLAGIPVIAPRRGGAPELVTHEVSGLLFEPCSADDLRAHILRVIEEPGLRERLAAAVPPVRSVGDQAVELSVLYEQLCADAARTQRGETGAASDEGRNA